jgi:hypothetical protein
MELVKIHHSKSDLKREKYMELVKDLEIPWCIFLVGYL